jgi:hypothetical protein
MVHHHHGTTCSELFSRKKPPSMHNRMLVKTTANHKLNYRSQRFSTSSIGVFLNKQSGSPSQQNLYGTVAKINVINQLASLLGKTSLEPKRFTNDFGERIGFICTQDVQQDGVRMTHGLQCYYRFLTLNHSM